MPKGYRKDGTPFGFKVGNQTGKLLKNRKKSQVHKDRIRKALLGNKNGLGNKNALGKHWRRPQTANDKVRGEKHYFWKGGITPKNERIRKSLEYKLWRTAVFERDKHTCIWCGNNQGGNLEADHIKKFSDFPELRFAIDNGRTLCKPCHRKTDTWGRRNPKYN